MKTRSILVALCMMVIATCMVAQTTTLRADIPFQFYVGDKVLPAGSYSVVQAGDSATILRLDETNIQRAFVTHPAQRDAADGKPVMVFQRIGGTHFLRQIWKDNGSAGRELPISKVQLQVAREGLSSSEIVVAMVR